MARGGSKACVSVSATARVIAFYLPQFHPIPENDRWWGKGFTEWTNVAKARPLFKGHYQPHLPADLGFYDLRVPEVREAQAEMARSHGIEGFCYWHYWFAGERLLERPFQEVLESGQPDFPFCLAWANETWSGIWHGAPDHILKEQTYPGEEDFRRHFEFLLKAFRDPRYIRVNGKPLLMVLQPHSIPQCRKFMELWRGLAARAGLPGLHLVAHFENQEWGVHELGFDAVSCLGLFRASECQPLLRKARLRNALQGRPGLRKLAQRFAHGAPSVYAYAEAGPKLLVDWTFDAPQYPMVIPNWDNTPRSGLRGLVLHDCDPAYFRQHLREGLKRVSHHAPDERLIFVKSWNEWAEGNHLEPDQRYGFDYLNAIRDEVLAGSLPGTGA